MDHLVEVLRVSWVLIAKLDPSSLFSLHLKHRSLSINITATRKLRQLDHITKPVLLSPWH